MEDTRTSLKTTNGYLANVGAGRLIWAAYAIDHPEDTKSNDTVAIRFVRPHVELPEGCPYSSDTRIEDGDAIHDVLISTKAAEALVAVLTELLNNPPASEEAG